MEEKEPEMKTIDLSDEDVLSLPLESTEGTILKIRRDYPDGYVDTTYKYIDGAWVILIIDTSGINK